ncbi:hypothetical protein TWF718_002878 [Orbilia javanica]|uniref:F-box domain-containing protein n=1 Tax=Orbilia javanica TaxID=47235 RepID=A0AAN8RJ65_9PEZI
MGSRTSSGPIKPATATLLATPVELIHEIASNLDEDDILALRLTCRTMNLKAREAHLEAKYRTRRVFLVPIGIENLLKISQHPSGVNRRIRRLVFVEQAPYGPLSISNRNRNIPGLAPTAGAPDPPEQRLLSASKADRVDLFGLYCGETTSMLTLAFLNLPRVRTIVFDAEPYNICLSRSELNLFYSSLGLEPGTTVPEDLATTKIRIFQNSFVLSNGLSKVLSAAVTAGVTTITKVIDCRTGFRRKERSLNYFIPSHPQRLSRLHKFFANLTILELCLSCSNGGEPGGNSRKLRHFTGWLEAAGQNLKTLRLGLVDLVYDLPLITSRTSIILLPMLPVLKTVALWSFDLDIPNLRGFLINCKNTLVDLRIFDCTANDNKEDWYQMIWLLHREFHSLRSFELQGWSKMWDIDDPAAPDYALPDSLTIQGSCADPETKCVARLDFGTDLFIRVIRSLKEELEKHADADGFWQSITNGGWKSGARVAATRLES